MISVIIPIYNVEAFLSACLDSVVQQSHTDLEIILVDDGSTDSCPEICDAYAAADARIKVIHQQNRGLSTARNAGIESSSGEYITFVDSDDFILPDMLERLLELARRYDADYVQCGYNPCEENAVLQNTVYPCTEAEEPLIYDGPMDRVNAYLQRNTVYVYVCGKLYSRRLFDEIRFPEGKIHEDIYPTLQLVHAAKRIAISRSYGYMYRIHKNSITHSPFNPKRLDKLDAIESMIAFASQNYPELLPVLYSKMLIACMLFMLIMASQGYKDRRVDQRLCRELRRYARPKAIMRTPFKPRLFILLACLCYPLGKLAAHLFWRIMPGYQI